MTNQILFLTGCINPNGMKLTALQDAKQRLEQYKCAIKFYLQETNYRILFVENSNTDITQYFSTAINEGRLEVLTFQGNDYNRDLGKGYGEMQIVNYALINSNFIQQSEFIVKITGRIKVLNIKRILQQFDRIENKTVVVNFQQTLTYADSKCWAASKDFYLKYLLPYQERINDSIGFHFEHALCKATHQAITDDWYYSFIVDLPRYSGIGGTENKKYSEHFTHWFPLYLKHKLRLNVLKK